jgi:FAD/FMN-containing dehydrogenase/Fe-S oxidoreductase
LYSTDASIYQITPVGVVFPKNIDDVVITVNECRAAAVPIIARGAGTGLTGGAVGAGLQIDFSRYMNRIGPFDSQARTIEVEPGVVLDELNAFLAPAGLHFAPDVATSSRATIGGMIANNSCGAHSLIYGRTVDHVTEMTVVLSSGETVTFEQGGEASNMARGLASIRDAHFDEIQRRFPKVMRSNGGYGLDRLGLPGTVTDPIKIVCGSEGTLGVIVGAKLKLTPLPAHIGLVVLHFRTLMDSLNATPLVLSHAPATVELIDRLIIDAGLANHAIGKRCSFLEGSPQAILVVEFFAESQAELANRIEQLIADPAVRASSYAATTQMDAASQSDVWNLRKSGLGLLMSRLGDEQPYSFIEDAAVDPARLAEFIERVQLILKAEGVHAGYYAHASVGLLHIKPVLNLSLRENVERMRRIADAVSTLTLEFGGAFTGEHGDGIVRSCWIEKMYGPRIVQAFREVKKLFDPVGLMNPGKIVDPLPMTENLRFAPPAINQPARTLLDFSAHGGMLGAAKMCSGVGQCRQRLVGTMCPSYMATGDETHTTRARANALRVALSDKGLLAGLDDPALTEVMDLCISCKACASECPTGVDMARLKAEYLHQRILTHGASRRSRWIADFPGKLRRISRIPNLANHVARSRWLRAHLDRRYGLDRRVLPPRLARQTFRDWFQRRSSRRARGQTDTLPRVAYLVDTWTNYFTPEVGIAAVKLLEAAGFHVLCPLTACCGRPAISQGLLAEARLAAEYNVELLAPLAYSAVPIVGTEPSCTLTFADEYPQLIRTNAARRVASQTMMLESFFLRAIDSKPGVFGFESPSCLVRASSSGALTSVPSFLPSLLYHAHCHQKALVGSGDAVRLMQLAFGDQAAEINSGCCGMAGSFGHEREHYDVAKAIGEQRLFPAIRGAPHAQVAIEGFSCRQQVEHHTHARPRHLLEYLADAVSDCGPRRGQGV